MSTPTDATVPTGVPAAPAPPTGVVAHGGEVRLIPLTAGRSSSDLIARIVARYGHRAE